ncbi:MAG: glycoside hydrolase N-terminal domain-containing protein, partial [Steroidobacteraceae bacterium]|nr:glycoside hydrolase N-terminal domain-containing protein [Steroidobacteraceae bacterium]
MSGSDSGIDRREILKGAASAFGAALWSRALHAQDTADPATQTRMRADTLWYTRPADEWVQALPIGNGRIGAMVFGGIASDRLQLNEDTFFAGGPYDPTNPAAR